MAYLREVNVKYDSDALDEFSYLPVVEPKTLFDAQFTYDLQPLLYEQITSGSGATITHDALNRNARLVLTASATNAFSAMQSFDHFRYQPGKAQRLFQTFNFGSFVANSFIRAGLYDIDQGTGLYLERDVNNRLYFKIDTTTTAGAQSAIQANWNLDKLDGTGTSGITLDITKTQILVIGIQALYVGRVRFGFDINGQIIWCHEFLNANNQTHPYIETANLPVTMLLGANGGAVTHTAVFQCCSIISMGGQDETVGYEHATPDTTVTAANGTATHMMSIRPKTTFNSIKNRSKLSEIGLEFIVTGNNSVNWQLCIGQAFSVAPTYADFNTTYSAFEYGTGGTLSGSPAVVIASGFIPATANSKGATDQKKITRYPITLDYTGAVRTLGTLTLLVTGKGGNTSTSCIVNIKEIR